MPLSLYQVDAFTGRSFAGNPAAVCPLDAWLPDALMQAIAAENNLSETAFLVPQEDGAADYALRWFTPTVEVDLCGHATLASAFVVFEMLGFTGRTLRFATRSGVLSVAREQAGQAGREGRAPRLVMDFPAQPPQPVEDDAERARVEAALGSPVQRLLRAGKTLAVLEDAAAVVALRPDMAQVAALPGDGVIATALGPDPRGARDGEPEADFVSRYFVPQQGIDEDPVTGSAHCVLVPYWAGRLNREALFARQVSARGGSLWCRQLGERVEIAGQAALFLEGTITLPDADFVRASNG